MELYHNQVTRAQGPFSLRMFHRSWGIMHDPGEHLRARARCSISRRARRFDAELHDATHYDIVGISSIIVNVGKVREMCRMVRRALAAVARSWSAGTSRRSPASSTMIDADHIVKGDGIALDARLPGRGRRRARCGTRPSSRRSGSALLGVRSPARRRQPGRDDHSVGGLSDGLQLLHHVARSSAARASSSNFYETGEELFSVMCDDRGQAARVRRSS